MPQADTRILFLKKGIRCSETSTDANKMSSPSARSRGLCECHGAFMLRYCVKRFWTHPELVALLVEILVTSSRTVYFILPEMKRRAYVQITISLFCTETPKKPRLKHNLG